jgi:tRNA (cmo5U34)-methyltransferase
MPKSIKSNLNRDELIYDKKWAFDENVTEVFDDMLERSIPDFISMRNLVTRIIGKFSQPNSLVLDLGCSTGGAIQESVNINTKENIKFRGVEISEPMRLKAMSKLDPQIKSGLVELVDCDLRENFPNGDYSVVLSILTVQFIPIEYRQKIISSIYKNLKIDGVFIFVEKILGDNNVGDKLISELYYELKNQNGYNYEQISSKRKSLEGVLVPVTSKWNEDLMKEAGFTKIQKFWQNLNFAGWVAFK